MGIFVFTHRPCLRHLLFFTDVSSPLSISNIVCITAVAFLFIIYDDFSTQIKRKHNSNGLIWCSTMYFIVCREKGSTASHNDLLWTCIGIRIHPSVIFKIKRFFLFKIFFFQEPYMGIFVSAYQPLYTAFFLKSERCLHWKTKTSTATVLSAAVQFLKSRGSFYSSYFSFKNLVWEYLFLTTNDCLQHLFFFTDFSSSLSINQ